jgi:sugar lactone lactonase YvrE
MTRQLSGIGVVICLALLSWAEAAPTATSSSGISFDVAAELAQGPGHITVTPRGAIIISLHQFFEHEMRVARVYADGSLRPFAAAADLNSVLGLQADPRGTVWLLDNAMRGGERRRLVGWHEADDRLVADIDLTSASVQGSFLNDLAVDAERQVAFIADPATGADAAILVVDLSNGESRRLLQGHPSVVPDDIDLIIDGSPVRIKKAEGDVFRPRVGVNPIALDAKAEWLYFGPMHGLAMYRVRTADLLDETLTSTELARRVERWSDKPISDGISIDEAGNLYLGELAANAIGVISADGRYQRQLADPRLSWIDAFSFGPDGYLYSVANQLHRTAVLNAGDDITESPFLILRISPFAGGVPGR